MKYLLRFRKMYLKIMYRRALLKTNWLRCFAVVEDGERGGQQECAASQEPLD